MEVKAFLQTRQTAICVLIVQFIQHYVQYYKSLTEWASLYRVKADWRAAEGREKKKKLKPVA